MIQGALSGGYYADPPDAAVLSHAEWGNSETWSGMLGDLWAGPYLGVAPLGTYVAGLSGYMSALSAVRACGSRINLKDKWWLRLPVSGWFRDADLPHLDGTYTNAAGFALDAYEYAAQAWSILESYDTDDPNGQIAVQAPIRRALIPPLLEGRL
jgi:hypothetical protein